MEIIVKNSKVPWDVTVVNKTLTNGFRACVRRRVVYLLVYTMRYRLMV